MSLKRFIGITVIAFAIFSVAYGLHDKTDVENNIAVARTEAETDTETVTVYFFFGNGECPTCDAIRDKTKRFLEGPLPETARGMDFRMKEINVEQPGNEEYILKYELVSTSVVLAFTPSDSEQIWRNLDRVWELADDEAAFIAYLENEISSFAEEVQGS